MLAQPSRYRDTDPVQISAISEIHLDSTFDNTAVGIQGYNINRKYRNVLLNIFRAVEALQRKRGGPYSSVNFIIIQIVKHKKKLYFLDKTVLNI